jgi:hypothetical protein
MAQSGSILMTDFRGLYLKLYSLAYMVSAMEAGIGGDGEGGW